MSRLHRVTQPGLVVGELIGVGLTGGDQRASFVERQAPRSEAVGGLRHVLKCPPVGNGPLGSTGSHPGLVRQERRHGCVSIDSVDALAVGLCDQFGELELKTVDDPAHLGHRRGEAFVRRGVIEIDGDLERRRNQIER